MVLNSNFPRFGIQPHSWRCRVKDEHNKFNPNSNSFHRFFFPSYWAGYTTESKTWVGRAPQREIMASVVDLYYKVVSSILNTSRYLWNHYRPSLINYNKQKSELWLQLNANAGVYHELFYCCHRLVFWRRVYVFFSFNVTGGGQRWNKFLSCYF